MTFRHYLKEAIKTALQDQGNGTDNGELDLFEKLCSSGVATNWKRITPRRFLESLLWCVGAVQKDYQVHSDYFSCQKVLFRKCDPWKIARNKKAIFPEWKKSKLYLKEGMVKSVLYAANEIVVEGWILFKKNNLLLPENFKSTNSDDWTPAYNALRKFPMVGDANAWYLIRNLYGGPSFKPDVHIKSIAEEYFSKSDESVQTMVEEVSRLWPEEYTDRRFRKLRLGIVDYILWWYQRKQ